MSIYKRRPNGYFITRFKYDLIDFYEIRNKLESDSGLDDGSTSLSSHHQLNDNMVTLIFNGQRKIRVNRRKLADSSCYFNQLLFGAFKESKESLIDIYLDEYFSFEAFAAVIDYAENKNFIRDCTSLGLHFQMIHLASFWVFDELVEILESHLKANVSQDNLHDIYTLAETLNLNVLIEECIKCKQILDTQIGSMLDQSPKCPLPHHETHHYSKCPILIATIYEDEEYWDDQVDSEQNYNTQENFQTTSWI